MSAAIVRKARQRVLAAIRELKHIDRRLTQLGCLNAHVHFKRGLNQQRETITTNRMYLLEPQHRVTRKRGYTYIGVNPDRQSDALARIRRFKVREQLRARIVQLKRALRQADRELSTALTSYRTLCEQARAYAREFAPQVFEN